MIYKFKKGDRIMFCDWQNEQPHYPGTILDLLPGNFYKIKWDDASLNNTNIREDALLLLINHVDVMKDLCLK